MKHVLIFSTVLSEIFLIPRRIRLTLSRKSLPSVSSLVGWLMILCLLHTRPLGPTQPLENGYGSTCLGVKLSDLDFHRSSSRRAEDKHGWRYASVLPLCLMACYSVECTLTE